MELRIRSSGASQIISLAGELSLYNVPEVSTALDEMLDEPGLQLVLDMTELKFIDSSGLAAIVQWSQRVLHGDGAFALLGVSAKLRKVFELVQLHDRIEFLESEAELP